MDELFEFNLKEIESAIDSIVNEAYKFRESDPPKSRGILEEGLKRYPDNEVYKRLLSKSGVIDFQPEHIKG